jgi:pyridoxamine 5'-phosphate oxidase
MSLLDLAALRETYARARFLESDADPDPYHQFTLWFQEAVDAQVPEPNTMTLATTDAEGRPHARIMLLKGVEPEGFVFFSNYESAKGRDLAARPHAALVFWWAPLERQVRIEGPAVPLSDEASDAYFASRPRGSQLGAWASAQSQPLGSREELEERLAAIEQRYDGQPVPRPPNWGGYAVRAAHFEFWQGRPDRLHDRLLYLPEGDGWTIQRAAP